MNRQEMLLELKNRASLLHAKRIKRLARLPLRILLPYAFKHAGIEHEIDVDTFFGRKMRVVLPEVVSVRIWRYGIFEEDVAYYLLQVLEPGDTFIDIGSHFGFFSMMAREIVGADGNIVSFEPMPRQQSILETNMLTHGAPCTHHLVRAAAGAVPGKLVFRDLGILGSAFASSKGVRTTQFRPLGEVEVEVQTVDNVVEDLGLKSCRLVKIDAENAEYDVIQGSLRTLRSMRPSLILETGDIGETGTRRVVDLVMSEGYEPYEFKDWTIRRHTVTGRYGYQNLLMIPEEKVADMVGLS